MELERAFSNFFHKEKWQNPRKFLLRMPLSSDISDLISVGRKSISFLMIQTFGDDSFAFIHFILLKNNDNAESFQVPPRGFQCMKVLRFRSVFARCPFILEGLATSTAIFRTQMARGP